ncbi:hypothetical protein LWI29_037313 [Acer saccharum]|uniref:O-fucosyltransferase family protein n=1 Tax=Acer saccharum TaxID=4024 RepID=A0AA39RSU0_ACESA|nr:hypothetical protein LWI29_037313 [Acer saccharum]
MAYPSAREGADRPPLLELLLPAHLAGHDETKERDDTVASINKEKPSTKMYDRLLNLASVTLAEICNAVAVASLLNETLFLLIFLYSNVWKDRRSAIMSVQKIQQAGALLVRRIRKYDSKRSMLDKQLLGNFIPNFPSEHQNIARGLSSYLALHLKFEEDMIAYSQCDFRGGKDERNELNFKHTVKSISLCQWNA